MRFKYGNRPEYADFFAASIRHFGKSRIKAWKPLIIIPVPIHKDRLNKRGYNQAALIARSLSLLTGIPANEEFVIRTKKTKAQKELDKNARRKNLAEAFKYVGTQKVPPRVLIVDDIFTTGNTADAIAAVLKENGAEKVYVATIAN